MEKQNPEKMSYRTDNTCFFPNTNVLFAKK